MSAASSRTPEDVLWNYFRAKDGNRPRLMARVFAATATLETVAKMGAISLPPVTTTLAHVGRGAYSVPAACAAFRRPPGR